MDIGECTAFDILGMGENGFKNLGEGCFSSGSWTVEEKSEGCLRPVVYLDGNMVEKVSAGQWKIKD